MPGILSHLLAGETAVQNAEWTRGFVGIAGFLTRPPTGNAVKSRLSGSRKRKKVTFAVFFQPGTLSLAIQKSSQ